MKKGFFRLFQKVCFVKQAGGYRLIQMAAEASFPADFGAWREQGHFKQNGRGVMKTGRKEAGFLLGKWKMIFTLVVVLTVSRPIAAMDGQAVQVYAKQANGFKGAVNEVTLSPVRSGSKELNDLIDQIFAQILTEKMTNYDKVKACYDWLITNTEYGLNPEMPSIEVTTWEEYEAYDVLSSHYGVCDHYAAAFAKMMQALGLNCRVEGGLTHRADGGYTPHAWNILTINGTEYVFDAQIDDNIAKDGAIGYYRFGKTYAEVPDKYIVDEE